MHGSGRNTTSGFRRAISCHYAASDCEKIYQEKPEEMRWYRPLRGAPPTANQAPIEAARPGHPVHEPPKSTRRA